MKPETARGARRHVPRRRRARGRPDPAGGQVPPSGLPRVAFEQPSAEAESSAPQPGDSGAGDILRIQPGRQRHRAAGYDLDPRDGFDPAEFADFLEADDSPMPADPSFKERLRQRLWGMVREKAATKAPPAPPRGPSRSWPTLSDPKPPH